MVIAPQTSKKLAKLVYNYRILMMDILNYNRIYEYL